MYDNNVVGSICGGVSLKPPSIASTGALMSTSQLAVLYTDSLAFIHLAYYLRCMSAMAECQAAKPPPS